MEDQLKNKLNYYKVSKQAINLVQKTKIVFLVGVSGAGKDTVRKALVKTGSYHYIVSHTTRQPRFNHGMLEKDGENYHFSTQQKVLNMLSNNEFVEAKMFSGNIYGTSVAEIKRAHDKGKIAITEIEVQGVAEYKAIDKNIVSIFLLPPDYEIWQQRLLDRYEGKPNTADLQKRMQTAKRELEEALTQPYFEYVINKDLDKTIEVVDEIAHGRHSDKKNEEARAVAQELLKKLD